MKSLLHQNIFLFSKMNPERANQITLVNMKGIRQLKTDNLEVEHEGEYHPFYEGSEEKTLTPYLYSTVKTIAFYGVGLGRSFHVMKEWLERSPERALVYFEDDLRMLKCLFETETGREMLTHPQVFIGMFRSEEERIVFEQKELLALFVGRSFHLIPSSLYEKLYSRKYNDLLMRVIDNSHYLIQQYQYSQEKTYSNLYFKLTELPFSKDGEKLKGAFEGIPSIICGAGPSLQQDFKALNEAQDKAFIFGAGTGMNVLNQQGIHADWGGGLDPTVVQDSRIRTNHAFMTPYFYVDNFSYESFNILHGPKIFLHKLYKLSIDKWFHEKLFKDMTHNFQTGYSTSNFLFVIQLF